MDKKVIFQLGDCTFPIFIATTKSRSQDTVISSSSVNPELRGPEFTGMAVLLAYGKQRSMSPRPLHRHSQPELGNHDASGRT